MNTISRTISGLILVAIGLAVFIFIVPTAQDKFSLIFSAGWSLLFIGIGIYIFFNNKEDDIEMIKDNKK